MFESLDKMMLAGLGALSMTREKAEKIFDEYVQRGQAEKSARSGFVNDLVESAETARLDLEKMIHEQTRKAVEALDLPTREDIKWLEEKLDELIRRNQRVDD